MATTDLVDDFLDGAARALRLTIAPEWRPAVKANLETLLAFADLVESFALPDDTPPAPLFRA